MMMLPKKENRRPLAPLRNIGCHWLASSSAAGFFIGGEVKKQAFYSRLSSKKLAAWRSRLCLKPNTSPPFLTIQGGRVQHLVVWLLETLSAGVWSDYEQI